MVLDPRDDSNSDSEVDAEVSEGRRALLKALAGGAGYVAARVALPVAWSTPVIATMLLPAHAQASTASTPEPSGLSCAQDTPVGSTQDNTATISATADQGTVSLLITPPAALLSGRKPFTLCESVSGSSGVAATVIPSADVALSGTVKQSFARAPGTYKYQLRWENGNSSWVSVEVK